MNKLLALFLFFIAVSPFRAQELYFPPIIGSEWEVTDPSELGWCTERIDSMYGMLAENNTHAFLILKDGKIVLEKYFEPFGRDSIWYWASAGKSLTAFLIGIAQEAGYVNIEDTTSQYLGKSWTSCLESEEDFITIRHQLTMTTGLDDGVANVDCTVDSCLLCLVQPGARWAYHNAPYTLLEAVIDSATDYSLNAFMYNNVTTLTGINGLYFPLGFNKVFFSRARDMARFGLLTLNKGKWKNIDVLADTSYYNQMVNTSQNLNLSYGYLWWLNGKASFMVPGLQQIFPGSMMPNAPADMISALGKNGQYLNVVPSQNLVVVRMGDAPGNNQVPVLLNDQIWEHINNLECAPTATFDLSNESELCLIYPNPAKEFFTVRYPGRSYSLRLFNNLGELVLLRSTCFSDQEIRIDWPSGVYYLIVSTKDNSFVKKVISNQ